MTSPSTSHRGAGGAAEAAATRRVRRTTGTWLLVLVVVCAWAVSLVLAVGPLARSQGLSLWDPWVSRIGAAAATWFAVMLIARRIAGPVLLVAPLALAALTVPVVAPRGWVLAAAAAGAGASYGLLGMVMTRPAPGLRSLRELGVCAVAGAAGAIVVTGYAVGVRPYRFRLVVLALTLLAALVLAWRLGPGFRSLGRRGVALIVGAVVVLAFSVVYVQLVRHWGSPRVVGSVLGTNGTIRDWIGASPRPIEALAGVPAGLWGVAVRTRRRQGWWMSAFGSLGSAGIATSLAQPSVALAEAVEATGYSLLIGAGLGVVLIGLDRLLTGPARGSHAAARSSGRRTEPGRFAGLL